MAVCTRGVWTARQRNHINIACNGFLDCGHIWIIRRMFVFVKMFMLIILIINNLIIKEICDLSSLPTLCPMLNCEFGICEKHKENRSKIELIHLHQSSRAFILSISPAPLLALKFDPYKNFKEEFRM